MQIPITVENEDPLNLHSLFDPGDTARHSGGFALGLLVIGIFVALLVVPVARRISRPLDGLRRSALKFSRGDLSHRTKIRGKDEIAQLADAFNLMAERLAQMIKGSKELTANVSHELRSPLARIRVAEEIIRTQLQKGETKKASKYLNDIQREIHELDRLIGRILEFSKLDLKASSPEKVPVNLSDLVVHILSRFETIIQKKDIACETDIVSGLHMKGDKKGLESALSNLLDNAVKFSPQGGRVTVRLMRTQDHLELTVFNTFQKRGDEALKHLFEPFYREAHTEASGTGLGLSIAKKIIERHGGGIVAANATDGIEFMVRFPI